MTDDDWRALIQEVERTRGLVRASRGMDRSADTQVGPRLAHERAIRELRQALDEATAAGNAPSWVVRYVSQAME